MFLLNVNDFNIEARYPDYKFSFYKKCGLRFTETKFEEIKGLYKWDNDTSVDGVIISHSHADHIGFHNYVRSDINFFIGNATKDLV